MLEKLLSGLSPPLFARSPARDLALSLRTGKLQGSSWILLPQHLPALSAEGVFVQRLPPRGDLHTAIFAAFKALGSIQMKSFL